MKIAIAQQNYIIGDFEGNAQKMIDAIHTAKEAGASLVVFSELSVCGYSPGDLLEYDSFIEASNAAIDQIKVHADTIGVLVGAPQRNKVIQGKDLYNAAWFLYEGEVKQVFQKTLLPTYDVFDEYRYFEPAGEWNILEYKGKKIAVTICEDIWNLQDNPLYKTNPMDHLQKYHPSLLVNLSASPFDYDHQLDRIEVLTQNVRQYKVPVIYCNAVGAQTEILFDGGSMAMNAKGKIVSQLQFFEEDFAIVDLNDQGWNEAPEEFDTADERVSAYDDPAKVNEYLVHGDNIQEIHDALIMGVRDYFHKMGFKKAILGSSGGIDSAVTLALAARAIGAENITAILMPSEYSSTHSVEDAVLLSEKLKNPYHILAIKNIYDSFLTTLEPLFKGLPFSLAEENIQSRSRGNLLMAVANKFNYILLNTSNKSELSTGYGTLYGDMAGGISVLGDVYKTQVYALAEYINKEEEIIPVNIITKAPSAELRPDQKDSDSLPEYDILDKVLYQYIERKKSVKEITSLGIERSLVERIVRMVNVNEYKRKQFCPILRVSDKAYGVGRRIPVVAKFQY
ncbi:NAD+ synthase [Gynurincola endophyticus]|uniref:NAD+ synthase n=1 Tax=Gynurincola endophyticus TaxID=2479004 RepID=UPI000F8D97F4|nr:NAD+ synthase [Gynurincola endophyticus]